MQRQSLAAWICVLGILGGSQVLAAPPGPPPPGAGVIAKVNGEVISREEFDGVLSRSARQKFYHGAVDEKKLGELRREVLEDIIRERLLDKESLRRKVEPDVADVERKLGEYEKRYRDSEQWQANREKILPELRAKMLENSRRGRLEQITRDVEVPAAPVIEQFYHENPKLFTEPEKDHVSLILLKVDPSSTKDVWAEALAEAGRIRQKIVNGDDFGDLAKLHSADETASRGGDMGYLHRGMLAPDAQQAVDGLQSGQVSEPVELLQGYGLFKLDDRKPPRLMALADVRERVVELYRRQKGEERWKGLVADLRRKADVWISPSIAAGPPEK